MSDLTCGTCQAWKGGYCILLKTNGHKAKDKLTQACRDAMKEYVQALKIEADMEMGIDPILWGTDVGCK